MIGSGLLAVDKPPEHTSFDVIARLRKILGIKKLGHTGTLDPMATGVLPVLIGRACKIQNFLEYSDKEYLAEVLFGIETDTEDITGAVVKKCTNIPTCLQMQDILENFRGSIMQTPPMYSAVKVAGKRLYELARQGAEIERRPRSITIYELELLGFDFERKSAKLRVRCSKGTYIRTLVVDIARALGSCATLAGLRRTSVGNIEVGSCITLEDIEKLVSEGKLSEYILQVDRIFAHEPEIFLTKYQKKEFLNGVRLPCSSVKNTKIGSRYRVYCEDSFLGIARMDEDGLRHEFLNI